MSYPIILPPHDPKDDVPITVTVFLLRCALLDLKGALQAHEQGDSNIHDWSGHRLSIADLENALGEYSV